MKKIYKRILEANVAEIMDYSGLTRKDTIRTMVNEFGGEEVTEIMIEHELSLDEALGKIIYENDMRNN